MFNLNLNSLNTPVPEFNKRNETLSSICQTCESQKIGKYSSIPYFVCRMCKKIPLKIFAQFHSKSS